MRMNIAWRCIFRISGMCSEISEFGRPGVAGSGLGSGSGDLLKDHTVQTCGR